MISNPMFKKTKTQMNLIKAYTPTPLPSHTESFTHILNYTKQVTKA